MTAPSSDLIRSIGRWSLTALVINNMIGTGVFILPGTVGAQLGWMSPIAWTLAALWGERFQGLLVRDTLRNTDNYAAAANRTLASNLKGKLFLMHGDLDDNVHPGGTVALVDALIKADKTFDFMVIPDADHGITQHPWVIRRTWDYFVQHLLGKTPPDNFSIAPPPT